MKFETPIAEVKKFDLKDVISASGENDPTDPGPTTSERYDTINEGHCVGGAPDNNQTNCF